MTTTRPEEKYWKPEPFWSGQEVFLQEVFVYGGGPSLKSFDPNILSGEKVIGCNDAYTLGPEICDVCVFGDKKWFEKHKKDLREYVEAGGIAVTNERRITMRSDVWWVKKMQRTPDGLSRTALSWNRNTGSSAINLALILGARRVFLLGFDMCLGEVGESNWHPNSLDKPKEDIYNKMIAEFNKVQTALPKVFPGSEIFNVSDVTKLKCFPIVVFDAFWSGRKNSTYKVRSDNGKDHLI